VIIAGKKVVLSFFLYKDSFPRNYLLCTSFSVLCQLNFILFSSGLDLKSPIIKQVYPTFSFYLFHPGNITQWYIYFLYNDKFLLETEAYYINRYCKNKATFSLNECSSVGWSRDFRTFTNNGIFL
jgi:hypothetical protein